MDIDGRMRLRHGGDSAPMREEAQPRWGCGKSLRLTQGSPSAGQPWAGGRNPFGIEGRGCEFSSSMLSEDAKGGIAHVKKLWSLGVGS